MEISSRIISKEHGREYSFFVDRLCVINSDFLKIIGITAVIVNIEDDC